MAKMSSRQTSSKKAAAPEKRSAKRSAPGVTGKVLAFDDDTLHKLTELARDRMATFQELADEAFADLLKKHGVPTDLKDALRKSVDRESKKPKKR